MQDDLRPIVIMTSSNSEDSNNLRPSISEPWESAPDDQGPHIITVVLEDDATITEVKLIEPENVAEFTVSITDKADTTTVTVYI